MQIGVAYDRNDCHELGRIHGHLNPTAVRPQKPRHQRTPATELYTDEVDRSVTETKRHFVTAI